MWTHQRSVRPRASASGFTETRLGGCEEKQRLLLAPRTPCWWRVREGPRRFLSLLCRAGRPPGASHSRVHLQSHGRPRAQRAQSGAARKGVSRLCGNQPPALSEDCGAEAVIRNCSGRS